MGYNGSYTRLLSTLINSDGLLLAILGGPIAQKRFKRPNGVLGKCLKKHFFTNRKTLKCQFI